INVLSELGLSQSDEYVIFRLISWSATHDSQNLNKSKSESILSVIKKMEELKIKVFISSEAVLSEELEKYKIKIKPSRLHDALAFAKLYIGEGGTTATEACLLATPSIIINEQAKKMGVHQKLQNNYELQYYFDNIDDAKDKIFELLETVDLKLLWLKKRDRFISENINPTEFLIDFVVNHQWKNKNE
ncbi:MAG: hypothetical protein WCL06_11160, partial [Bacteroidota bacterium]